MRILNGFSAVTISTALLVRCKRTHKPAVGDRTEPDRTFCIDSHASGDNCHNQANTHTHSAFVCRTVVLCRLACECVIRLRTQNNTQPTVNGEIVQTIIEWEGNRKRAKKRSTNRVVDMAFWREVVRRYLRAVDSKLYSVRTISYRLYCYATKRSDC